MIQFVQACKDQRLIPRCSSSLLLRRGLARHGPAQVDASFGGRQSLSSTAYYYISKAGEITMPVNLWGT